MSFIPVHSWAEARTVDPTRRSVRLYVWQLPVRLSHWVAVLCIAVLSFTGYYMHNPFIISRGENAYLMGTMRFIHLTTASVFIGAFLLRMYWFLHGNKWSRWGAFVPLKKKQWQGIGRMVSYYSFLRRDLVHAIGHNALAAVTYMFMFFLMFVEILTGLALYSMTRSSPLLTALIGWLPRLIDIQYLRLTHFCVMFGFFTFVIHHVYSAVLVSWEERNGLIESIFTGYKFMPETELEELGQNEVK
jgi:Ni/Fe-hydrogenase 1 B-type cytochrome subunit